MLHRQLWRQRNIILLILGFIIYLNVFHEDLQKKSSEKRSLDGDKFEELEGVELEDFINTNSKKLDEEGLKRIISSLTERLKSIDLSFAASPDFENLQTSPVSSTSSTTSTTPSASPSSTVSISTSSTPSNQNSPTSTDATITSSPSSTSSSSSRNGLFS